MPIQTSQITTDANGDLTIAPNGTGETKVASVDVARVDTGTTEDTPVSVAQDGTIKKTDISTLPEVVVDNLVATDLIAVQKADGDFYHVKAEDLSSAGIINPPDNATLTITPTPGSGAGTQASPFILTAVTVSNPGDTVQTIEVFSISGAPPNGILYVTFTDNQGGRFQDKVVVADAAGVIPAFQLTFTDNPASTTGTVYTGKVRFGTASVYCSWVVNQQSKSTIFKSNGGATGAPNASPPPVDTGNYFGTGIATWADGARTLNASGSISFNNNGGGFGTGPTTVADGDIVKVIFDETAVDAAADGATITGTLASTDGLYSETFTMVKDASPGSLSLGSLIDVDLSSTQQSSPATPSGYNAKATVTTGTAGSDEMTSILVSIDSGALTALPTTIYPGQTISVQGDVGATISTAYTANVNVGSTSGAFTATTTATLASPTITTPSITAPVDGSTDLSAPLSVTGSTYTGVNSPGPHTSSDWEIYEAGGGDVDTWTSAPAAEANNWQAIAYGNGKYVAVASFGTNLVMYSTDGISWTAASSAPAAATWYSVCYDNGKFVAVANGGQVMYSSDGISWTAGTASAANQWYAVTYGNGKYVAVAQTGTNRVMYSTDGISWTGTSGAPDSASWRGVTYGNGKFVAVAASGQAMYSTNGTSWTSGTAAEANQWNSVTFGNGKFVAVAQSGTNRVMHSTDGISWTSATAAEANMWEFVRFGSDLFMAVSGDGTNRIMYSNDGSSWTGVTPPEANFWNDVVYGGGKFVAVAGSGTNRVMYSEYAGSAPGKPTTEPPSSDYTLVVNASNDPTNLTSYPLTSAELANGKSYYSRVKYKDDSSTGSLVESDFSDWNEFSMAGVLLPKTWISASTAGNAQSSRWMGVVYGGGRWVAVGQRDPATIQIMTSTDGITWSAGPISPFGTNAWEDVTYGNGKFVAVTQNSLKPVAVSSDGLSWTVHAIESNPPGTTNWVDVIFANNLYVACRSNHHTNGVGGVNTFIAYSSDGITWTLANAPAVQAPTTGYTALAYGNGRFVAVAPFSVQSAIYSDDNAATWTLGSGFPAGFAGGLAGVAYGNGMFVAAMMAQYTTANVWYSSDGANWNPGTLASAVKPQAITFGNGVFVITTEAGPVQYSEDGVSWFEAPAAAANRWRGVAYGDDKYVAVSYDGTNRAMYCIPE